MASNHTQTYGLNQWALSDSVIMADFNEDNLKTEQALLALKEEFKGSDQKIEQALQTLKASLPKFHAGSYVGTGTFGQEKPTTLTFDFTPKMVYLREPSLLLTGVSKQFIWIPGTTGDSLDSSGTKRFYSLDGNTLSWYVTGYYASEWWQLNGANTTYYYVAIG